MKNFYLTYILVIVYFSNAFTEVYEPVFNVLDINNGLITGNVFDIVQDHQGYVWIGTSYGLSRYDGSATKNYYYNAKDENTIPSSSVKSIEVDKYDNIWIGTLNGLCIFDKKKNKFYRFKEENSELLSNIIADFSITNNVIWIMSENGINYAKFNKDLSKIEIKTAFKTPDPSNVIEIGDNKYMFKKKDFYKFSFDNVNNKPIIYDTLETNIVNVKKILQLSDKKILAISQTDGLYYLENETIKKINSNKATYFPSVLCAKEVSNNRLVLTTTQGIYISNSIDFENIKFEKLKSQIFNQYDISMVGGRVVNMSKDGTIWVGTLSNGILSFNIENTLFKNIIIPKGEKENEFTFNKIRAVVEDCNGNILIGTDDRKLVSYSRTNEQYTYLNNLLDKAKISGNQIICICEKNKNTFYLSIFGYGGGIAELECKNGNYQVKDYFRIENIISLTLAKKENYIWAASNKGLLKVQFIKGKHDTLFINNYLKHKNNDIPTKVVVMKYHPNNKSLLVGTYQGLYLYYLDNNDLPYKYSRFVNESTNNYSISNDEIRDILVTYDNRVYIATDYGINELILKNDTIAQFINFNTKPNMPSHKSMALIEDHNKNIWINTYEGLIKYDYINNKYSIYNKYDGLSNNELHCQAQCITKDGMIVVGSTFGANLFNPQKNTPNKDLAVPILTLLNINNEDIEINTKINGQFFLKKDILYTDSITLTHHEKSFSISFSALHFTAPQKIKFKYKLEGFDNDFIIAKPNELKVSYSNLNGGDYKFLLMASNNDGIWNEKPAVLHIKVIPPLIERLWFKLTCLLFFIILIFIFFNIRIRSIEKKKIVEVRTKTLFEANKALLEINKTKDRLFSIISHDLKNPVGTINGFSELLLSKYDKINDEKRKKYVTNINSISFNLLALVDRILQWSRSQLGAITVEKHKYDISDQVTKLVHLYANQAHIKGIELISHIEKNTIVFADFHIIDTILRNLISNAIKFTKHGNVSISYDLTTSVLKVADTGVGMSAEKASKVFLNKNKSQSGTTGEHGTGLGLEICKDFITLHGGEIWVDSQLEVGTTISFRI